MRLPESLQAVIDCWLATHGHGTDRRAGSAALSATYRKGGSSAAVDLAAYLVARLPATYAAVFRVLSELKRLRPDFSPGSMLDAGSGPGTASWAAAELWPDTGQVTFLDSSRTFLALAQELAAHGPPPLAGAAAREGRIEAIPPAMEADLTIAAYALAELPVAAVADAARGLWAASRSTLVLVEPGTPQGFARIRAAREALLKEGAVPLAPCTHALACPITGDDWCHFSVRLPRSRAHMHAKDARVPFEDERFSYLIFTREAVPIPGARIIAPPLHAKPGVSLRLCTQGRLETAYIARRDAQAYKLAKKLDWGDLAGPATEEDKAP